MGKILKEIDGLPVLDAKKSIKLKITKNDVTRADVKKPNSCAAAQACLRNPGVKEVRIHLSRAYVRQNDTNWQRFLVSDALRSEIVAFDRGGRFEPGEYALQRPHKSKKLGTKDDRVKPRKNKNAKKRRKPHVITDVRSGPA